MKKLSPESKRALFHVLLAIAGVLSFGAVQQVKSANVAHVSSACTHRR